MKSPSAWRLKSADTGEDIQREVYEKHLQDEGTYNSWRGLKAADVARRIEQNFTTDLQYYRFDKTECATCAHNTNNLLLFRDGGCGHCANRTCLAEMNASYLMERAVQIMQTQPGVSLCRDRYCTKRDGGRTANRFGLRGGDP